ncbi:hypothetical protein M1397_03445 [Candidatus Marsarchaeota archaeon]|nr:hypothetical protein [Candidatus Marsarchaeota archaeon]
MKTALIQILLLAMLTLPLMTYGGSAANITANVNVPCPFGVALNLQSTYVKSNFINTNYTVKALEGCSISTATGNFTVSAQLSGKVVYAASVSSGPISQTPLTVPLSFNTVNLVNSTYVGKLTLQAFGFSNTSSVLFTLLKGANVTIRNMSITPQSVNTGSPITIKADVYNDGQLSATNMTSNITINGPISASYTYSVPSLLPSQSENISIQIPNAGSSAGSYTAYMKIIYNSNGFYYNSNTRNATYTVTSPPTPPSPSPAPSPSSGPPPISVTPVPGIAIQSIPAFVSATAGQGLTSQLTFSSSALAQPTQITLSVPANFSSLITLSSRTLTLPPGGSITALITFKTTQSTLPGTYVIPLTINATPLGAADPTQTEYLTFVVYSTKNPLQILGQLYIQNSSALATGVIQVGNSGNSSIVNGTLVTMLPLLSASNSSSIVAYGLPNNITETQNGYQITWHISKLPAGQIIYAYYNVKNPNSVSLLLHAQNVFSVPSPALPTAIFKSASLSAPTFYSNSTNHIETSVFYTGTNPTNVNFVLTGPSIADILNPFQFTSATPNQYLQKEFNISVGNYTGTLLFYLTIYNGQYNQTYQLPVVVLQKPPSAAILPSIIPSTRISFGNVIVWILAGIGGIAVIVIIVMITRYLRTMRRPFKKEDNEINLARLRKRLRGEENE